MRILTWAIRIALFILLVAFAAKNTDPVRLRFYFDLVWDAPLVALLLAFFVGGVVLGIMAMLGAYLAQRRELSRLEKKNEMLQAQKPSVVAQPPAAEG